jgi:hypothetical protein
VTAAFDGSSPSYCYAVRAEPLIGGATIDLFERCVDNNLEGIGTLARTPDEIEQWLDTCAPPLVDAGPVVSDRDDPSPARDAGAARDAGGVRRAAATGGCQLRSDAPVLTGPLYWTLAALVPWLRSKTSRRSRPRGSPHT